MPRAAELRELDDDELDTRLAEYRRELFNLRFQLATGQLDNAARIPHVRHDLARVLTIMRDREIALAEGRDAGPVFVDRPRPARRKVEEEETLDEVELLEDDEVGAEDDEVLDEVGDDESDTSATDDFDDEADDTEADEADDADGEEEE